MKRLTILVALLATSTLAEQENLLRNPGFETSGTQEESAQHWRMHDPDDHGDAWGTAIRAGWRAREGRYIGVIRGGWAGVGEYGGFWQEVEASAGATYRASAWFWADGAWRADTQELKIEFWNTDRTEITGSETVALHDIGEIWVQKEIEALAPEGTGWVRIVINASGTGNEGALQIDEASIVRLP
ncbi:MAG TPA: hypothetical protein PKC67_13380 [Kiritimatiellia bacterium]|nr:hypothetical protein [Kiritimatiellia bacterium]HMP35327.1 hypothetical protein [Kiritimatiellia bacterium]